MVFKTKGYSKGANESYKARLLMKDFIKSKGVGFNETISSISSKYFFGITINLVTHFNLELKSNEFKIAFLDGDLEEDVHMQQQKG